METKRPLPKFDPKKVRIYYIIIFIKLYKYDPTRHERELQKQKQELDKSLNEVNTSIKDLDIHKKVEIIAKKKKIKVLKDYMASEHVN